MIDWLASIFRGAVLVTMGTGIALLLLLGFQVAYLIVMPMNWWIDYNSATVIGQGRDAKLFITRRVKGEEVLAIRTFAELHGSLDHAYQHDQYCESSSLVTAEPETGPIVMLPVRDVLRPVCDFARMPCEPMKLQIVVQLELPYSINKRRRFISEPYFPSDACAEEVLGGSS